MSESDTFICSNTLVRFNLVRPRGLLFNLDDSILAPGPVSSKWWPTPGGRAFYRDMQASHWPKSRSKYTSPECRPLIGRKLPELTFIMWPTGDYIYKIKYGHVCGVMYSLLGCHAGSNICKKWRSRSHHEGQAQFRWHYSLYTSTEKKLDMTAGPIALCSNSI